MRKGLVAAVGTGLTVQGGGTLRQAQAVKSGYFDAVYFVTAEIQGAGLEGSDDVGTWAKSGPLKVGGGLIYSVDSIANEFSDWGRRRPDDAQLSMDDGGARRRRSACRRRGRVRALWGTC